MSSPKRRCEICGRNRPDSVDVCPICGGTRQTFPDGSVATGYAPTVIIGKDDVQSGHEGLLVSAPGASSESRLSPCGEFTIRVTGAYGLGQDGEARVKKLLGRRLQMDGVEFAFEPGVNSRGEDGVLVLGGVPYALQITMALSRKRVDWAVASAGTATASASISEVTLWIDEVINSKVSKTDPENTILALDANHLGIMSDLALVSCYQERFGSASQRFGFAAVWLVGPTVERCFRLG